MYRGTKKCWTKLSVVMVVAAIGACSSETASPDDERGVLAPPATGAAGAPAPNTPNTPSTGGTNTPANPSGPVSSGAAGSTGNVDKPGEPAAPSGNPSATTSQYCAVRKVLDSRCTACHNEQKAGGAPMSLKTYADLHLPAITDKTKKVYEVVGVRVHDTIRPMPPQEKLTAEQLKSIDTWVDAGGPEGADPTCAGTIGTPSSGNPNDGATSADWPEKCDAVYTIKSHGPGGENTPYMVPAGQEIHPKISIPAPWGNENVQMVAMRAISDNMTVLHHWILYGPRSEFLVGWAPGKEESAPLPPDVGMNMPGGNLTLDMHYFNLMGTKAEPDSSGLELCVLKGENLRPKTAAVNQTFSQFLINIPAGAVNHNVTGQCTFTGTTPVTLLSASPHAHTLATYMKFTVTKKSGEMIVMHDAPFNFNEQQSYPLPTPIVLENGDTVTTTCTYNNPGARPVTFGENTGNEMCFNFAVYYPMGMMQCGSGTFAGGLGGFGGR